MPNRRRCIAQALAKMLMSLCCFVVSDFVYLDLPTQAMWKFRCVKREYLLISNEDRG